MACDVHVAVTSFNSLPGAASENVGSQSVNFATSIHGNFHTISQESRE